jgi:hypothetical protein
MTQYWCDSHVIWFDQVFVLIVNTDCYSTMPSVTHYWVLYYAVIKTLG